MSNIKVLDVTLRDGGCVNDFNFGQERMLSILESLETSNVEYIELGYIDDKKGSESGRTQFINEVAVEKSLLKKKIPGIKYVVMMDYGKFNVENLLPRNESGIDGIRVAFHKKDWKNFIEIGKTILEKGYDLFVQPMITIRYEEKELKELIQTVNDQLAGAKGFYIVDSFGEMKSEDLEKLLNMVDNNLNSEMALGFHSHNNIQLSFSNAITLLKFNTSRNKMLDSSLLGMGKGAGNLNTELILQYLNINYSKNYSLLPVLNCIDKIINPIHKEFYWGYSIEYYLSSINHCTPSYANYFYNIKKLTIEECGKLLSLIDDSKKISFDKNYAENLYFENFSNELEVEK